MTRQTGAMAMAAFLLAAGCGQAPEAKVTGGAGGDRAAVSAMVSADAMAPAPQDAPPPSPAPPPPGNGSQAAPAVEGQMATATPIPTAPLLAYSHSASLVAPLGKVHPLMRAHEKACVDAGAQVCQVVNAGTTSADDTEGANLSLRAEPRWLAAFLARLETDAQAADGRVTARGLTSEDLTRAITDTEATLRAQTLLRDKIEEIIRTRRGSLSDLLEAQRELARVQGEIDAFRSNLAVMRARVAMSSLDLAYASKPNPVSSGALGPLGEAVNGFLATMAESAAVLIRLLAALLPFALVLGPLGWLGARWLARRRAAKAAAKSGAQT